MSRMMSTDDYAAIAETLLDRAARGDAPDSATYADAGRGYALLAVASALSQIAENIETAWPGQ